MDRAAAIAEHFAAIGRDEDLAARIYAEDAVLEYPQSNERIRGRASIVATRQAYPGPPAAFEVVRISGAGDVRTVELVLRFGGEEPHPVVAILDFADNLVSRERIYIAEPWEAPEYRRPWAEPIDPGR